MIGRWGRAARWLAPAGGRVLDVGCAFGFGTNVLAAGSPARRRWVAGIEADSAYVRQAAAAYPALPFVRADAARLPVLTGSVDAVALLDVLEHVAGPGAVVAEVARALRPGGTLILTVPHDGPLARLDSLNVYQALAARWHLPPLEPSERSGAGRHVHFRVGDVQRLLGGGFEIERVARTGLGVAEIVHLGVLLLCRAALRWERAYLALRFAYFTAYLIEDQLPAGHLGYHLAVRARRRAAPGSDRGGGESPSGPRVGSEGTADR